MTPSTADLCVTWDYTQHAAHYDKRADYSDEAIETLLAATGCTPGSHVADVGAGTGKLTKLLLRRGLVVHAVEPNEAMRAIGITNTRSGTVTWTVGTGEATGLPANGVHAVAFGSSFNVVDQPRALSEAHRILEHGGWFACLWNHRDLDDPIQRRIESIIRDRIPDYSYGSRREDARPAIDASGLFGAVRSIERTQVWTMTTADVHEAWKSHATLKRQTGSDGAFQSLIAEIAGYLETLPYTLAVPYVTRIYFAQRQSR